MPQKKKKIPKVSKKTGPSAYPELDKWVHQGTAESLKKIDEYIRKCGPGEKRDFAEMARGEAEFWYYSPRNEKDEEQYVLAKIIRQKEKDAFKLEMKIESAKVELRRLNWDKKIHEKLLKKLDAKRKEEWKYNFSEDYASMVERRLNELEDNLSYEKAWIKEARKMITLKKYSDVPDRVFSSVFVDDDFGSFWDEEDEDGDHDNMDFPVCPSCGSDDVIPEPHEIPF